MAKMVARARVSDSVTAAGVFGPGSTADSKAASFSQSDLGPFLVAMVATPLDDVDAAFDGLVELVATCGGTMDAARFTTLIEPVTFPTLGDEASAVKASAANPNGATLHTSGRWRGSMTRSCWRRSS